MSPDVALTTPPGSPGHGALASVPPALAVALPFSTFEKTSSLILASVGCAKAGAAEATSSIASIATNNVNFFNSSTS